MKITLFLLVCTFFHATAMVHAQKLSLHVTSKSVKDVLYDIQKQTGYDFLYAGDALVGTKPVSLRLHQASLKEVLDACMVGQPLTYEIDGTTVLFRRKSPAETVHVQQKTVNGRVLDIQQKPIAHVNVVDVNSRTVLGQTKENGDFQVQVPANISRLSFEVLGYTSKIVTIEETAHITVTMEAEVGDVEEVVVVGYGTLKRKEITSAVASVKAEDFNGGSARSPMELIQGKVAGLSITREQGNNPNSGASIQLRGVTSMLGDMSPLVVIDGIPGGNLDLLQQDDIASIDVLKDGSAAAIYGTRANAGVILVTTKKGKAGSPVFQYGTYVQKDFVNKRPELLSAAEYRELIDHGKNKKATDMGSNTDMYDALINKDNGSHYHNLSASGGSDNANYRGALHFSNFQGIALENERQQVGGRLNFNQKGMQDHLELQVNLATNINNANLLGGQQGDFEQAVKWNPTAPIYQEDGSFFEMQENYNPIARYANRISQRNQQTFAGDARLVANIIDGLNASFFASYQRNQWNDRGYRAKNDWDQRVGTQWNGLGYAGKSNELQWTKTFEPTINYQKTWNDRHHVQAMAGYSYQYSTLERFNVNNNGFITDGFLDWNLGAGTAINDTGLPRPGMGSFKEDNTLIAVFGRINYAYQGRYFLQAIIRREGSSRFGANNKWGNFPALSAGWTISQEEFMQNVSFVNELKARVGFGVTGNQGIGNYQSLITLSTGGVYLQDGKYYQTYGPSRNPNPDLRWERKEEWNFGLDFSLFSRRLSGSIDVYNRHTKDLLFNYTAQQPSYVMSGIMYNVGTLRNSGVELTLQGVAMQRKDFRWEIDLTANTQSNKLTQLSSDVFKASFMTLADIPNPGAMGPAIRLEEGGVVGNFYGKRFAQFSDNGEWMFYKADGSIAPAQDVTEQDWAVLGNGFPNYIVGLNQRFTYKGFDLNVLLRGKFGFEILNLPEVFYSNQEYLPNNIYKSALGRHAQLKAAPMYSDYYIERGDFVRLDNLTLGYTFNIKTPYVKNLRTYISGRNIMTITGYSGLDPEIRDSGLEPGVDARGFYPRTQSWTVGVNVGF